MQVIFGGFALPCPQQQQIVSNTAAFGGLLVQNECPSQGGPPQGGPGFQQGNHSLVWLLHSTRSAAHHGIHLLRVKVRACLAAALHTSVTAAECPCPAATGAEPHVMSITNSPVGSTHSSVLASKQSLCSSLWACRKRL